MTYLQHYGTPRHSGRYPYGSGKNPYQHAKRSKSKNKKNDNRISDALKSVRQAEMYKITRDQVAKGQKRFDEIKDTVGSQWLVNESDRDWQEVLGTRIHLGGIWDNVATTQGGTENERNFYRPAEYIENVEKGLLNDASVKTVARTGPWGPFDYINVGLGNDTPNAKTIIGNKMAENQVAPSLTDIAMINPDWGKPGTTNNCAKCAASVELTKRGYGVMAGRSEQGAIRGWQSYWFDGAHSDPYSYDDAIERLDEMCSSPGISGTIAGYYPNNAGGHAMHFTSLGNGICRIEDGQSNKTYMGLEDAVESLGFDKGRAIDICRLDDCKPNFKHMAEDSVVRFDNEYMGHVYKKAIDETYELNNPIMGKVGNWTEDGQKWGARKAT